MPILHPSEPNDTYFQILAVDLTVGKDARLDLSRQLPDSYHLRLSQRNGAEDLEDHDTNRLSGNHKSSQKWRENVQSYFC